ncbi:DUF3883 domain-containing protein [Paucibacter sp. B2R-40]|uniref:DUF3883 domain-containing protein n=1 Tax=Paucibacter sp. B2R-40 TaxID=2893554 RepID=UPI0021E37D3F|nr:DUF3883 domain-containing protein [Paucibacter sp. B2R-40]MCV2356560.1 DUF3883 domain-containing protein [Paucibacter sp. B2R-40]
MGEKSYAVGDDVRHAVELMTNDYGAIPGYASDHDEDPRVAYSFPRHGGLTLQLPFNKRDLIFVMRDRTRNGQSLSAIWPSVSIKKTYPKDGNAGSALMQGKVPYLTPSRDNVVIRVKVARAEIRRLLDLYLAPAAVEPAGVEASGHSVPAASPPPSSTSGRRVVSMEDLLAQLNQQGETGKAGELAALEFERARLSKAGCVNPVAFVHHVALSDVGRGYDIESSWPGEERCIEVKSTTRLGSDIYLSENERKVLAALGDKGWLYRVLVTDGGGKVVGEPLQNPVPWLEAAGMTTAVWRASDPAV